MTNSTERFSHHMDKSVVEEAVYQTSIGLCVGGGKHVVRMQGLMRTRSLSLQGIENPSLP